MDGALLGRIRWRRRGAWLWPTFVAATAADAAIGHLLPPAGQSQSLAGAALVGCFLNLLGIVLLTAPGGTLLRRFRGDLPKIVARDYAGTTVVLTVTAALLLAGLIHRPTITSDRRAMQDAIVRAQAFIGDRAPDEFRRNLQWVDMFAIQPGAIYRACVPNPSRTRTYCVIVNRNLPFGRSVSFAGYEPNSVFAQGTQ